MPVTRARTRMRIKMTARQALRKTADPRGVCEIDSVQYINARNLKIIIIHSLRTLDSRVLTPLSLAQARDDVIRLGVIFFGGLGFFFLQIY